MFWKPALFLLSGKEASILVDYSDQAVLSQWVPKNSNLLRYVPENRSIPRAVTGKWSLKN